MRVKFETVAIPEANTADVAYDRLDQLFAGELLASVTRQAKKIGYGVQSERALAIASLRGMSICESAGVRAMGHSRYHEPLGLHADGFVVPGNEIVHNHETLELEPGATAHCALIQAKRDLPRRQALATAARWGDYINMGEGELDDEMFHPVVYRSELNEGDVVDFWASGPITMVHHFTVDPPDSDRTIAVTLIGLRENMA